MLRLNDMPLKAQVTVLVLVAALATTGLHFTLYKPLADENQAKTLTLESKQADIRNLRPYEHKLVEMNRQIESLKQQLEVLKNIVPEEKEADEFMHMVQDTAQAAGIEVRRYTAKPNAPHDFYTEVPFDMELDGSYYSMVTFFDKVAKLERIVNVNNLQVGALKDSDVKLKKTYKYAPSESVVATCTTSTFFSNLPAGKPAAGQNPPAAAGKR
ncbi:MAG TPA: type 4a pilus biogenesis protein PilO [Anaerolineales bacterium]